MMIPPYMAETIAITGSDMLRIYRDAVIEELARRQVTGPTVARSNVHVELQHRPHLGRDGDPLEYVVLKSFVLHPAELARGDGVMLNRETVRDHLWVEARWL
jgi:hypothetical protein